MTLEQILLEMHQVTVNVGKRRAMSLYEIVRLGAKHLESALDNLAEILDLDVTPPDNEDEDDNKKTVARAKKAVREMHEEAEALTRIFPTQ